jgi:hypothetical protein
MRKAMEGFSPAERVRYVKSVRPCASCQCFDGVNVCAIPEAGYMVKCRVCGASSDICADEWVALGNWSKKQGGINK